MKKTPASLLLLAISLASSTMKAEDNLSSFSAPHWGIRASIDVSNPGDIKVGDFKVSLFDTRLGVSFGGYYFVPLSNGFYLEPGVFLFYDTYGLANVQLGNEQLIEADGYVDKFGISIPLHCGFHFDIWENASLFLKTGPQLSIGLVSQEHIKDVDKIEGYEDYDNNLYGKDGGLKRFNLLWDVAAGLDFGNFNVSLEYDFGLLNLLKDTGGMASFKESYFRIGVGYSF